MAAGIAAFCDLYPVDHALHLHSGGPTRLIRHPFFFFCLLRRLPRKTQKSQNLTLCDEQNTTAAGGSCLADCTSQFSGQGIDWESQVN